MYTSNQMPDLQVTNNQITIHKIIMTTVTGFDTVIVRISFRNHSCLHKDTSIIKMLQQILLRSNFLKDFFMAIFWPFPDRHEFLQNKNLIK